MNIPPHVAAFATGAASMVGAVVLVALHDPVPPELWAVGIGAISGGLGVSIPTGIAALFTSGSSTASGASTPGEASTPPRAPAAVTETAGAPGAAVPPVATVPVGGVPAVPVGAPAPA